MKESEKHTVTVPTLVSMNCLFYGVAAIGTILKLRNNLQQLLPLYSAVHRREI